MSSPNIYLRNLPKKYVPFQQAGIRTHQTTAHHSILRETARNPNQHIGIYYMSMVGSIFYEDQNMGSSPLMDPFYQEPKTTTIVYHTFNVASLTVNSRRWKEFMDNRQQGTVVFRIDIMAVIRFKVSTWGSKHHKMHANCDVAVGQDGSILPAWKNKKCPVYFT
ncbi:hypothetical protein ES288_A06G178600v1 [Gossypium darwinii]|uniref:Late embryogenesis abundant protein LEA-2 subgroup domain-containing protein n=1 Tax=Gossypium darwinii TaxID=34276 RepID=A0A5D2G797_GOSDA|nr:hypothetical protein ES288_A06G178600v1 [Gossypium darwinii]